MSIINLNGVRYNKQSIDLYAQNQARQNIGELNVMVNAGLLNLDLNQFDRYLTVYSSVDTVIRLTDSDPNAYMSEIIRNGVYEYLGEQSDQVKSATIKAGVNIITGSVWSITFDDTTGTYTVFTPNDENVELNSLINTNNIPNLQCVLRKNKGAYWINFDNGTIINTTNQFYQGIFYSGGTGCKIVFTLADFPSDFGDWDGESALPDNTYYVPRCKYDEFVQKAQAAWPDAYQLLLAKVVQYDIIDFDGISYHPIIRNS